MCFKSIHRLHNQCHSLFQDTFTPKIEAVVPISSWFLFILGPAIPTQTQTHWFVFCPVEDLWAEAQSLELLWPAFPSLASFWRVIFVLSISSASFLLLLDDIPWQLSAAFLICQLIDI